MNYQQVPLKFCRFRVLVVFKRYWNLVLLSFLQAHFLRVSVRCVLPDTAVSGFNPRRTGHWSRVAGLHAWVLWLREVTHQPDTGSGEAKAAATTTRIQTPGTLVAYYFGRIAARRGRRVLKLNPRAQVLWRIYLNVANTCWLACAQLKIKVICRFYLTQIRGYRNLGRHTLGRFKCLPGGRRRDRLVDRYRYFGLACGTIKGSYRNKTLRSRRTILNKMFVCPQTL